jgi:hypothetical protein
MAKTPWMSWALGSCEMDSLSSFPRHEFRHDESAVLDFLAMIYQFMERTLESKKAAIADPYRRSREMQDQLRDVLSATVSGRRAMV